MSCSPGSKLGSVHGCSPLQVLSQELIPGDRKPSGVEKHYLKELNSKPQLKFSKFFDLWQTALCLLFP